MIPAQFPQVAQTSRNKVVTAGAAPAHSEGGPVDSFVGARPSDPGIYKLASVSTPTTKVVAALRDPGFKAAFLATPRHIQDQVTPLSDAQLKVLKGGVSGTTAVGPITVDKERSARWSPIK